MSAANISVAEKQQERPASLIYSTPAAGNLHSTHLRLLPLEGVLGPHALAVQELRLPWLDVPVQVGDQLLLIVAHACSMYAKCQLDRIGMDYRALITAAALLLHQVNGCSKASTRTIFRNSHTTLNQL
jgi:hypothetical protein